MMMNRIHLLVAAGIMACASTAAAQDIAAAEALFNRGLADMEAGRYEVGCRSIAESQRLDPRPGTLFTLATCEERWGRIATAVTRYGDYLALYERLPDARRRQQGDRPKVARAQRDRLAAEVPELTITLPPGAPAGTVVKRDGQVLAEAALGVGLPVDPGDHTLTTQAPGGAPWEHRITIGRGEKQRIALEVKRAAAMAEPPPVSVRAEAPSKGAVGPSGRRIAAYATLGLGGGGLAAGAVLGAVALARKGVVDRHCGAGIGAMDGSACDRTGLDAALDAKRLSVGSTIGIVSGLAGIATGTVLLLTEPRGGWVAAGVLSMKPGEAVMGARGAW